MRKFLWVFCLAGLAPYSAVAQVSYSNITNFSGFGDVNGNATNLAGNTITALVADLINPLPASVGSPISNIVFSVANFNGTAVSARARLRFWAADGAGGAPGTLLAGFDFTPISFTAGSVGLFGFGPGAGFNMPAAMWAGITFDNNGGATGATLAQMNNLGQGIFDPPTIGTSADTDFVTTAAGDFAVSNPVGNIRTSPFFPIVAANYGWQFTVTPVPEPGMVFALVVAGLAGFGAICRLRRKTVG